MMSVVDNHQPLNISARSVDRFKEACTDKIVRTEADMRGFFQESEGSDKVIYEVYEMGGAHRNNMAITVMKPGTVGREYHMTRGHFHENPAADEIYFCLAGIGLLLVQNREGHIRTLEMNGGEVVYVPAGWAHRSINIGSDELVFLAVYPKDAGHDYGSIEKNGFRSLVIKRDGVLAVVDNPKCD